MARMQLAEEVHAPTGIVFDYVDQHAHCPEFFKGFCNFELTSPLHRVGSRLKMDGRSAGATLSIEVETSAVVPEREISSVFVSGLRGHWEWLFQPIQGGTRVTVIIDYDIPQDLPMQANDRSMLDRALRSCMEKTLRALKEHVESQMPVIA